MAATVTLCQGRNYASDLGPVPRSGDSISYCGIYTGLINRLSKALYGRRAYECGSRIRHFGTLEGDRTTVAHHFHISLERPEWKPFDEFKLLIEDTWRQSPWVKPDLDVREIHGAWVYYIPKKALTLCCLPERPSAEPHCAP